MTEEEIKFPIGKFSAPPTYTNEDFHCSIKDIKGFPGKLRKTIALRGKDTVEKSLALYTWHTRHQASFCAY